MLSLFVGSLLSISGYVLFLLSCYCSVRFPFRYSTEQLTYCPVIVFYIGLYITSFANVIPLEVYLAINLFHGLSYVLFGYWLKSI